MTGNTRVAMKKPRRRKRVTLADFGMVGITQTIMSRGPEFGEPTSNAMQAALATVLGLPLNAVPHFADEGWWDVLNTWLIERHGVTMISCTAGDWEVPRILHLSQGLTMRGTPHVVVGFGGQLLHDPHPSGVGLSTVLSHELFVSVQPGSLGGWHSATTEAPPQTMIAQAQPIPEVALRTTLAASGVKRCTRCGVVKALGEFPRVPGRPRVGSWCRPCAYRSAKASNERTRLTVLAHYSHGTLRCACCGQDKLAFLALDHIAGGGAIHRKEIGGGANFYRWLIKSRFPPGLEVKCHNCNLAKSAYGSCPHTRKTAPAEPSRASAQVEKP
jgi:hypothetical protein